MYDEFEKMGLSRLLEERDALKIRVNLMQHGDSTNATPVATAIEQLAAVESLIAKKRMRPEP